MSSTNTDKQREEGYYWVKRACISQWSIGRYFKRDDEYLFELFGERSFFSSFSLYKIGERILPLNETK